MRSTILLIFLTAFGCDSGNSGNPLDMSMAIHKDLSSLVQACDVAAQDCGGTGMKCVATNDSTGSIIGGACVADGTVAEGMTCTPSGDTMYLDDCKKGLFCDPFNVIDQPVCRTLCTDDTPCPTGQRCLAGILDGNFGWCIPTCTPFSSTAGNCPSGTDCGDNFPDYGDVTDGTNKGFFICKTTGAAGPFESCDTDADCGSGMWCGFIDPNAQHGVCIPNCNDTTACQTPPDDAGTGGLTASCTPYDDTPNGAGWCDLQ